MADENDEQRIRKVRVTNGLDKPFHDRFNGVPITLAPGQTESLPLNMAEHFFGFRPGATPESMLRHIAKRQGWSEREYTQQNPESRKELAEEYFSKLKIEPVYFRLVEEKTDPKAPVPAEQEMAEEEEMPGAHRLGRTPNWLKKKQEEWKAERAQQSSDQA